MPRACGSGSGFAMSCPICSVRPATGACASIGARCLAPDGSTGGMREFMQRDEVVAALRQAKKDRQEISRLQTRLAALEKAWRGLTREEQAILHHTVVDHRKGNVEWLCGELGVEPATVYRRRNKALKKLGERL